MKKRLRWAAYGFAYAVVYGLFTAMATGGGHGNFLWFFLFLLAYLFGLFFVGMGFIVADLKPLLAKSAGIAMCVVAIGLTVIHLSAMGAEGARDVQESWDRSPVSFVVMSLIHILPVFIFVGLIVRSFLNEDSVDNS